MEQHPPTDIDDALQAFLLQHRLPRSYLQTVARWFAPLAAQLATLRAQADRPLLVGINGSQGSGKSTLAALLTLLLTRRHGLSAIDLSIDDFYLTHAQRAQLADSVHPLLATRGVPGTHDVALMRDTLARLHNHNGEVAIPRFDKARDDRAPESAWQRVAAPLDLVILEGWCLGVPAQAQAALRDPVNPLEADEDPASTWRGYVNRSIAEHYAGLYAEVDRWIMLRAPSFDCVFRWRLEQETKLAERLAADGGDSSRVMSPPEVARFIQHYQRLTEHGLQCLPSRVDFLYQLDDDRNIVASSVSAGAQA